MTLTRVAVAREAGVTAIITTQDERTPKTAEPTAAVDQVALRGCERRRLGVRRDAIALGASGPGGRAARRRCRLP